MLYNHIKIFSVKRVSQRRIIKVVKAEITLLKGSAELELNSRKLLRSVNRAIKGEERVGPDGVRLQ